MLLRLPLAVFLFAASLHAQSLREGVPPAPAIVSLAPGLQGAVQPQLAALPGGGVVAAVFGAGNAIYFTAAADGRVFTPPVKVGQLEKLALRMRRGPRVAATEGRIAVTAISHADGNLHLWRSGDGGKTWSEGEAVNQAPGSAREGLHAMASDGRATVAVAWLDDRSGGKALWSRDSRDGGATWQPEVQVYASPEGHICECCHPSLAIGPGGLAAMWRNSLGGARDLWTASSADGGRTWSAGRKLGEGTWKFNACPMDGGGLAADAQGVLHTVWRRERTVFAAVPGQPEQKLADNAAQAVIAAGGGRVLTAWEQGGRIVLQEEGSAPRPIAAGHAPALIRAEGLHGFFLAWESEGESLRSVLLPDTLSTSPAK